MNALIIEDEPAAADNLRYLLRHTTPKVEVLDVLPSVARATRYLRDQPAPQVIFSDIELADGRAFDIYREVPPPCPVVFTTAYDEHALTAFRHGGIDYLLKPIREQDLRRALSKIAASRPPNIAALRELLQATTPQYRRSFLVQYRNNLVPLRDADIAYFYTGDELVFAQTYAEPRRRYVVGDTLETLEGELDPNAFFRANRQYIVGRDAMRALKPLGAGRFVLKVAPPVAGDVVISKAKAPSLRAWLSR